MGVPGTSAGGWLRGRGNRKEYWIFVGVLVAIGVASTFLPPIASAGSVGVMSVAQIRRLHDIGRTGWWVAAFLGLQIVLALGLLAVLGTEGAAIAAGTLLTLVPIAWLGAIPGQPYENRFGPPPGKRSLKEIFD